LTFAQGGTEARPFTPFRHSEQKDFMMNSTTATTQLVTLTDQRGTSADYPYVVEIKGWVYGIGYGQTPEAAYAEARICYEDALEERTVGALREVDRAFLQAMRAQKAGAS
jgi:hypothetical protein